MTTRFVPASGDAAQPPVSENGLDHFRDALIEQRRFRTEQLRELDATAAAHDVSGPHSEIASALRVAARTALAEVEAALGRMELGQYGLCTQCGSEIARARLEIVPMAALCMNCQRAGETGPPAG